MPTNRAEKEPSRGGLNIQYLGLSGNTFTGCLPTGLETGGNDDLWRPELQALPSCAPTFGEESYAFTVARTANTDTTVGTVNAQSYDLGGQATYEINSGNDDGLFNIDNSAGNITLARAPTQDDNDLQSITVKAQDSHGQTSTVQVQVTLNS